MGIKMNTIASKERRLLKFALALAVMSSISSAPAFAKTDVHVLDVGQGLSVLVKSQDHYMLYDGGDRDRADYVVSYLKQQGIAELDYMIASHYDADHINGLVGALNTTSVKQVFAPEYTTDTKVFQSFRDISLNNTLRQTFDHSGLTNTRFTDQHRIVLRLT